MPSYIVLFSGLQSESKRSNTVHRAQGGRKAFEHTGLRMKEFYMVMGQYDCVAVAETPDDAPLAKAILSITSQGSFMTTICRAFTEREYRVIVGGLT